ACRSVRHPGPPHPATALPPPSSDPRRTPLPHPPMVVEVVVLVVVVGHADPAGRGRQNRLTASMSGFECLAVARIRNGWRPGFLLFLVLRTFTTTSSWSPHTCWLNLLASSPVVSRNFDGVALSLVDRKSVV